MHLISKILVRLLVSYLTHQRAAEINRALIRILRALTEKTKTEADDELLRTFGRFVRTGEENGHRMRGTRDPHR